MKDNACMDVSKRIDHTRMDMLMKSGRGKKKERLQIKADFKSSDVTSQPSSKWEKMKEGTPWKNTELALVTAIDRQTIGKLRKGSYNTKNGSTTHLIEAIAEALDVDPAYLTGEQKAKRKRQLSPEEKKKRMEIDEAMERSRQLRILSELMKIFSIKLIYDDAARPKKYTLIDADGEVIRSEKDIEDLSGLMTIIMNYLKTGSDIISIYFGDVWIDEI